MGVDKANVRWVFHDQVSESVDAYYQEIGRAGRDGARARARLFYRPEDLGLRRFFAAAGAGPEAVERVADELAGAQTPVDPSDLREKLSLSRSKVASALQCLERTGALGLDPEGILRDLAAPEELKHAAMKAAGSEEQRLAFEGSRVEMMRAYAERRGCRRTFLLGYFGEEYEPPCGNCDNCDRGAGKLDEAPPDGLRAGTRVRHGTWGEGTVGSVEGGQVTLVFDTVGYKTLDAGLVTDRGLLERISE
jgi:ATP-dependent DNA helicase RecQ